MKTKTLFPAQSQRFGPIHFDRNGNIVASEIGRNRKNKLGLELILAAAAERRPREGFIPKLL